MEYSKLKAAGVGGKKSTRGGIEARNEAMLGLCRPQLLPRDGVGCQRIIAEENSWLLFVKT